MGAASAIEAEEDSRIRVAALRIDKPVQLVFRNNVGLFNVNVLTGILRGWNARIIKCMHVYICLGGNYCLYET